MRTRSLASRLGVGTLCLFVAACASGGETGVGGAGGEATTTTTTSSTSSTTTTSSTSTSTSSTTTSSTTVTTTTGTGGSDDGNDTFATAESISLGATVSGFLEPTGDVDFYSIAGQAGQALFILTRAQNADLAFDPDTIDTVITLHDSSMKQIAENNDRVPRGSQDSELLTILPTTGTYYIQVRECHTWASNPNTKCGSVPADKLKTDYLLSTLELDPTTLGNVEDEEAGAGVANATPVTYAPNGLGSYYLSILWGTFTDAADVDIFEIKAPDDVVLNIPFGTSGVLTHHLLPAGTSGDGSTSEMGKVWITDALDPTVRVAQIDQTNYTGSASLGPHLDLSKTYYLWVEHAASPPGANDFYFMLGGLGYGNTLETDETGNDQVATAEPLLPAPSQPASYYVEGDIVAAPADVDHFAVAVPSGTTQFAIACTAQRSGSGLRGFRAQMLKADGTPITGTIVTESATKDAYSNYLNVPAGSTELIFKVSATTQDPMVTSTFYRCGVHFL